MAGSLKKFAEVFALSMWATDAAIAVGYPRGKSANHSPPMRGDVRAASVSGKLSTDVRYWPLADIPCCTAYVRFRE